MINQTKTAAQNTPGQNANPDFSNYKPFPYTSKRKLNSALETIKHDEDFPNKFQTITMNS